MSHEERVAAMHGFPIERSGPSAEVQAIWARNTLNAAEYDWACAREEGARRANERFERQAEQQGLVYYAANQQIRVEAKKAEIRQVERRFNREEEKEYRKQEAREERRKADLALRFFERVEGFVRSEVWGCAFEKMSKANVEDLKEIAEALRNGICVRDMFCAHVRQMFEDDSSLCAPHPEFLKEFQNFAPLETWWHHNAYPFSKKFAAEVWDSVKDRILPKPKYVF